MAPLVTAVIAAFGRLWKLESDGEAADYVRVHGAYLAPLLLFEVVHEGAPASWMRRIAALGGLESRFESWVRRLESDAAVGSPHGFMEREAEVAAGIALFMRGGRY